MAKIILLNKPFNVLCQFTDKEGRANLADFVDTAGVYPAGRLDYDSEGLVILTDDGKLQHQISHPDAKQSKTYWVQVEGSPSHTDLEPLRRGIKLNDGLCRPAKVALIEEPAIWPRTPPVRQRSAIPTSWLELSISEGRNRQVRRMTAAIGHPTLRLIRAKVGDWTIDGLAPGESRQLTIHAPANNSQRKGHSTRRNRRL
ncbi:pseudouridine synthase [Oceanicoccus sagamiensis]|uniref:Pseudouridine synthase n=1 Tax=Oceanicoccus sagamiensis TaxID=716816 RepID=A0A1X9NK06_9GAMM|nr:pseudouridine synthase [Oceanicoccus sagamiensis]ARN75789.1 pseudouridine synthase [Oceanicoccus sagamiensis]